MTLIALNKGHFARVDDADATVVLQHTWHVKKARGGTLYAYTNIKGNGGRYRYVSMHRLLAGTDSPEVDHWDGDGLNNTRLNLRPCSHSQNMKNRHKPYGVSKYLGVCLDKDAVKKRWVATIGKRRLGRFFTEIEAAIAYDRAAIAEYGEFANPNFGDGRHSPDYLRTEIVSATESDLSRPA